MAKRFTSTEKWSDLWFCKLTLELRCAYLYILDNCDQVGVWEPNTRLADFQLGYEANWNLLKELMLPDRLHIMNNGSWWLKKFCPFQYGDLSESNSKSKTTQYYIKLLKKHSLWIVYTETIYSPKEKEKDKEQEKDLLGKQHFEHLKLFFSKKHAEHEDGFKTLYSEKEYATFQIVLKKTLEDYPELMDKFKVCMSIGDWIRDLERKPYSEIKPAIKKMLAYKIDETVGMAIKISQYFEKKAGEPEEGLVFKKSEFLSK